KGPGRTSRCRSSFGSRALLREKPGLCVPVSRPACLCQKENKVVGAVPSRTLASSGDYTEGGSSPQANLLPFRFVMRIKHGSGYIGLGRPRKRHGLGAEFGTPP